MTENTENGAGMDSPKLAEQESNPLTSREVPEIKVKSEQPDAEVEAKLRALNAKFKAEALATSQSYSKDNGAESTDDSDDSSSADDKKAIEPVKSSNEILAELFGVFNAAPPEELLDDKNLLKKKKKVKKEKKEKRAKKKKPLKSDGECSDSDAEGKHKHKRRKHKHKHKEDKDKDREKLRDKSREKAAAGSASSSVAAVTTTTTGQEKEKSENRKRSVEDWSNHSDSHPIKRERQARERDRFQERERRADREKEREQERERERDREREREKERARSSNSFYNGHQESDRSKGSQVAKSNSRLERDLSDVSLSDEDTYLREKASNGRQRPHNSFYDGKEEPKLEPRVEPKAEPKRHVRETEARRRRQNRSRSRSRDLGIDKKRLLEIARKNAISMFKRGTLPGVANMTPEIKDKVLVKMRYGGRTVQDLTDFCKKISKGDGLSDLSSDEDSDVDKNGNAKAFHHPFQLKEREPIVMHIRNSTPIVPATSLREEQTKAITMQFPVSSGQTHRMNEVWVPVESKDKVVPLPALPPAKQATDMFKETPKNVFAMPFPQQDQEEPAFKSVGGVSIAPSTATTVYPAPAAPMPVPPPVINAKDTAPPVPLAPFKSEVPIPSAKEETPAPSSSIFPEVAPPSMDVSSIITQRLSAIRRLQDNPGDSEALKMMYHAQRNMSSWAHSKHLPGQFTGSTGAQVMKAHELNSGPQLWVRKDQLTSTKPVTGGMGMALLQKMGWKPGEGLGRCKTGSLQPLLLDVKLDKRGLVSREDLRQQPNRPTPAQRRNKNATGHFGGGTGPPGAAVPVVAPLVTQDKHPVCVLNELSSKNKWTPPQYTLRQDTGPPHCRLFLFSVEINGQSYTPERGCLNKKEAKLNAAQLCLRSLGILPSS
ncbi:protein SON [Drosophila serrata]|uniref:protein SON n=1 Tax=Drosophila serrata TaxID=7274 RepID=UPI000A1D1D22|nr:protein SON [Drosophila serrata]XP_020808349.1 protein SON [Drosophila serrata]